MDSSGTGSGAFEVGATATVQDWVNNGVATINNGGVLNNVGAGI